LLSSLLQASRLIWSSDDISELHQQEPALILIFGGRRVFNRHITAGSHCRRGTQSGGAHLLLSASFIFQFKFVDNKLLLSAKLFAIISPYGFSAFPFGSIFTYIFLASHSDQIYAISYIFLFDGRGNFKLLSPNWSDK
jgi:hypothetical protein